MGGKSGGGQAAPYEAPNTLSSAQSLRIIDAISEGVVSGFANGDSHPLKSVFFNDTPVQALDGTYNFKGVAGYFQRGTPDQSYIPGFDVSERVVPVSAAVKLNSPIVRSVTDSLISRLRVTVAVERNAEANDKGDVHPAKTHMRVSLVNAQRAISRDVAFTEKSSGVYYQDVVFDKLPDVPFSITVTRLSPDSNSDKLSNSTFFSSYVEIIDAKLSYPHTAVAALLIDSDQFGNSIPRRNYLLKGRLVKVPSNYDPETRSYSGTMWDGSFKQAWTNNPAWVFYDVLTQPRFSTIARRLKVADIDKWSLYQIARYCDELVDDGFGGREPRFVCNAYITDLTQAGEFLQNLASVFTGMPIWNGTQISVVMDGNTDPVALYNNTNVKDGLFTYSGAAYKSIHTAVHVQYVDKHDGYRTKTEYVADDNAIARYGLNIKQITAFGCDSRGQAARFGAWTLQTELRQQNMVSFEIGREGLKHLPYDIVQVMDNRYAGAELSGRVMDIDGNTVTLDRDVSDIVGAIFFYSNSDGLQSAKVLRHPAKNKVVLEKTTGLEIMAGWALSGKVKPRLYRAIGIKENSEDGTYTVTGLLHDPQKYATVDTWAKFDRELHTLHRAEIALTNPDLAYRDGKFTLSWDNLTADGKVLSYDIKIYRNNELYRHIASAKTAEIAFENLPNGVYRAEIRGRNARGVLSEPLEKDWTIDYNITALRTAGRLMAVDVTWTLPQVVVSELSTELWYGTTNNLDDMRRLVVLPYPQNTYTLTGVAVSDRYYFRARVVDKMGNAGEWTPVVTGDADKNPTPIVQQVQGAIGKSALSQSLIASLNSDMAGAAESAAAKAQNAAAVDASNKVAAEASARQRALQAETSARTVAIQAAANKAAQDLTAKAAEIGTRIGAVENVNATQAQQISTVTASQANTAAGLETEKRARADGDKAEAAARATLAARVATAEGNVVGLQSIVADEGRARAEQMSALTARFDGLVGGRNLLKNSGRPSRNNHYQTAKYAYTDVLKEGEDFTLTIWGGLGEGKEYFRIHNSGGYVHIGNAKKISDGLYRLTGKWRIAHSNSELNASNRELYIYHYPQSVSAEASIAKIKLERGTLGTDWTPAPEDVDAVNMATSAELTAFKEAQASKDAAQTAEINAAKSQAQGNAAEIQTLKTTKADTNQVVAVARTGLRSEWQAAAAAAQTAAVQAASVDAQAKADKAKNDAIAEATRLNAAANAKIDTLKETVAEQERAISRRIDTVTAEVGKLGNAGGNLNTDSEFINGFNDQFSKEGGIFSVVKIGGVNAGKADRSQKAGDGWFTLASVPANKGIYQFSIYMLNQTAQLVKMYPRYLNRRREWVKVGTTRKLTNNTDIVPSVPSRDDPADLNGFTRVIWNVDLTASENLHFIEIALHFPAVPANQEGAAAYFAKPMICEIPHINMPPVPYAANTSSAYMAAKVEQSVSAVADVRGKLQSMYTLKTETVSGNRRVISGLALGADGQTGDSQVLVYANKFAVVDPASKSIKAPFVVKTEGGKTKMVLDGDMIASGVIQGKHIVAGSRLVSPYIVGGTLEVNSIIGGNIYEIAILPHNGQLQRTVTFLPSVAPRTIVIRWDIAQIRYVGSNSVAFGGGDWVKSVHSSEPLNARRMPGMYIQTIPANKRVAISFGADDAKISNDIFVESYLAGNARYIEVS